MTRFHPPLVCRLRVLILLAICLPLEVGFLAADYWWLAALSTLPVVGLMMPVLQCADPDCQWCECDTLTNTVELEFSGTFSTTCCQDAFSGVTFTLPRPSNTYCGATSECFFGENHNFDVGSCIPNTFSLLLRFLIRENDYAVQIGDTDCIDPMLLCEGTLSASSLKDCSEPRNITFTATGFCSGLVCDWTQLTATATPMA